MCIVLPVNVARTLLGLLEAEPTHGYTLKHRYDQHFSRLKPLAYGQVYASLSRFERDGLAAVTGSELGGGPQRTTYAITADGVTAVERWIREPEQPTAFATSTLFTKTVLALLSGRPPTDVLDAQRQMHLVRMRELTRAQRDSDPAEQLAITYELTHLDADLRWIEEAGQQLDRLARDLREQR